MAHENTHTTGVEAISRLHEDLLWLIFMKNTELPFYNPPLEDRLMTAIKTSQVCLRWRNLTLRSSSLWGRLIDLNLLNQKCDALRNTILRRSGNSFLWIQGRLSAQNSGFFFSILEHHWTRVQRLNINDNCVEGQHPRTWKALYSPAPNLESILLTSSSVPQDSEVLAPLLLFANDAPILRQYRVPDIKPNPKAPWLSNIGSMTFSIPFNVPEIFEALEVMPLLEFLSIRIRSYRLRNTNQENKIYTDLPSIHLPKLNKLRLRGDVLTTLPFLERITPAPGCSLFADISSYRASAFLVSGTPTLKDSMAQHLGRYTSNYLAINAATDVTLRVNAIHLKTNQYLSCLKYTPLPVFQTSQVWNCLFSTRQTTGLRGSLPFCPHCARSPKSKPLIAQFNLSSRISNPKTIFLCSPPYIP
ncbi:hypothetical protein GALMADRAFT_874726 [Galerina marginata CBS 339.88]|uniref:F-box domain-containing protein n=1 Tax=Galerina marginata (strain CBS 339.88) TaxID=685588 RepID=A0A067TJ66_GALM3|nr:hypothetical protein GALMADRAFT_874726 [Galerina marginata CBS 339.88]